MKKVHYLGIDFVLDFYEIEPALHVVPSEKMLFMNFILLVIYLYLFYHFSNSIIFF